MEVFFKTRRALVACVSTSTLSFHAEVVEQTSCMLANPWEAIPNGPNVCHLGTCTSSGNIIGEMVIFEVTGVCYFP